jgi:autoinducer 2 (AI-2) kinase
MYLGLIEAVGRIKTTEIKADGGGMYSDLWAQILSDVMDKKILIPEIKDCSALGAAILGYYGLKKFNSLEEAIERMVRFEKEFNPNKTNVKVYKKLNRLFMPNVLDLYQKKRVTKDL